MACLDNGVYIVKFTMYHQLMGSRANWCDLDLNHSTDFWTNNFHVQLSGGIHSDRLTFNPMLAKSYCVGEYNCTYLCSGLGLPLKSMFIQAFGCENNVILKFERNNGFHTYLHVVEVSNLYTMELVAMTTALKHVLWATLGKGGKG